jgi:hypothetical protein
MLTLNPQQAVKSSALSAKGGVSLMQTATTCPSTSFTLAE